MHAEKKAVEKMLREENKREALEKSKHRQENPDYFLQKKELNKKPELKEVEMSSDENNFEVEEIVDETATSLDDIFRSAPSGRNKIHIR